MKTLLVMLSIVLTLAFALSMKTSENKAGSKSIIVSGGIDATTIETVAPVSTLSIIYLCKLGNVNPLASGRFIIQKQICSNPQEIYWEAFKIKRNPQLNSLEYESSTEYRIPELELEIENAILAAGSKESLKYVVSKKLAEYDFKFNRTIKQTDIDHRTSKLEFVRKAKILTLPTIRTHAYDENVRGLLPLEPDEAFHENSAWMPSTEIINIDVDQCADKLCVILKYLKTRH